MNTIRILFLSYYQDNKLIVYYMATVVRGRASIACVISYWDYNERLPDTGLPEFVSQFIQLQKELRAIGVLVTWFGLCFLFPAIRFLLENYCLFLPTYTNIPWSVSWAHRS